MRYSAAFVCAGVPCLEGTPFPVENAYLKSELVHTLNSAGDMSILSPSASILPQIPILDGVRGIAALMVMVFHGWQAGAFNGLGTASGLARVSIFGQTGV